MNYQDKLSLYVKLAKEGKSKDAIATTIGVDRRTVLNYEKKTGVKTIKLTRKPNFNYHYFDLIDTEQKAYLLGFVFADGYIESNERCLTFNINKRDIDLFDKISDEVDYKGKYSKSSTKNCIRIYLSSVHLVGKLKEYGINRNKTNSLRMPKLDNEDLYRHFLRGYFDGDGHIGKRQCALVIGSHGFLRDFLSYLNGKFDNEIYHQTIGAYYRVQLNRRDHNIVEWLYKDNKIALKRKNKAYLENWSNYTERIRSIG